MFQKTVLAAALVALPVAFAGEAKAQCGVSHSYPGYSATIYRAGYGGYPSVYRTYRSYGASPYYSGYRSYYSPYDYDWPYRNRYWARRYPSRYTAGYRYYGPTVIYGRRGGYYSGYGWPSYGGYGWPGYYGRSGISLYFGR